MLKLYKKQKRRGFIKALILLGLVLLLASCTTTGPTKTAPQKYSVDLKQVQEELGVQYYGNQYGVVEIPFNTCNLNSIKTSRCEMKTFIYVRFRVRCRNSQDTVQYVGQSDIKNLSNSKIRWRLGPYNGVAYLDAKGITEVRILSNESLRQSRFVIFSGDNYLGIRVNELKQILVPSDWC